MLGRTDSAPARCSSSVAFVLVAGSLGVRLAYWQVARRRRAVGDGRPAVVDARTRSRAGAGLDLRPDRHGRAGDQRHARPARGLPQAADPGRGARRWPTPGRDPRPRRGDAAAELDDPHAVRARVRRPRPRPRPDGRPTQIRTESTRRQRRARGAAARARAGPRLPAAGRRPGHDARRAPARASSTATGEGQYGVEQFYQDQLAGMPRVVAAQKDAAGNPVPDSSTVLDAGLRRARTCR